MKQNGRLDGLSGLLRSKDLDIMSNKSLSIVESQSRKRGLENSRYEYNSRIRKIPNSNKQQNSEVFKLEAINVLESDAYKQQTQKQYKSVYNQDFKGHDQKPNGADKLKLIKMAIYNKQKGREEQQQQQQLVNRVKKYNQSQDLSSKIGDNVLQQQKLNSQQSQMNSCNESELLLKEQEMLFNFIFDKYRNKIEVDRLIEDNWEYIYHIFRLCECFNSDCEWKCEYELQNGPKLRSKTGMNTSYNQHYLKQNNRRYDLEKLNSNMLYYKQKSQQVDNQTINRHDYNTNNHNLGQKNSRFQKRVAAPHDQFLGTNTIYKMNYKENVGDVRDQGFGKRAVKLVLDEGREDQKQSNYKQSYKDYYETMKECQNSQQNFKSERFIAKQPGPMPTYNLHHINDNRRSLNQMVLEPRIEQSMKTRNNIELGQYDVYDGMYTSTATKAFRTQPDQIPFQKRRKDTFQVAKQKILEKMATLSIDSVK